MIRRRGRKEGEGKERNEKEGYDKKERAEGGGAPRLLPHIAQCGGEVKKGIGKRVMIRKRGRKEGNGKGRNKKEGYDKKERAE